MRAEGMWNVPTTLDEEKTFNVFMRCFDAEIQKICDKNDPAETMGYLR